MNSLQPKKIRTRLIAKTLFLLIAMTVLVGIGRYLSHHERVLSIVNYDFAPGYGHRYVEYLGKFRVMVPIEPFNLMDLLTCDFLLLSGLISLLILALLKRVPFKPDHNLIYRLLGVGFVYLGLDEVFKIHEFLGLNLAHLSYPNLAGMDILNRDFNGEIIVAYAVVALVFSLMNLKFILADRTAFCFFFIGLLFHTSAAAIDFIHERGPLFLSIKRILGPFGFFLNYDEFYEVVAAFFYLFAVIFYGIHTLSQYYVDEKGSYLLKKAKS